MAVFLKYCQKNTRNILWKLHIFLLSLACTTRTIYGFNVDTQAPVVRSGDPDTLFGFTVALHREGNTNWALVGAPREQTNQPDVEKGGAVYKCPVEPLTNPGPCEQIPFDLKGHTGVDIDAQVGDKSNQWFGASLKSAGVDGKVVACAPRYVWFEAPHLAGDVREPVGTCYVINSDLSTNPVEYSPCQTENNDEWGFDGITHCQAGFSVDITKDSELLLLGAVGSYYWQGQIYIHWLSTRVKTPIHKTKEGHEDLDSNLGGQIYTSNLVDDSQLSTPEQHQAFDDNYRGYAVTIGEFSGDTTSEYVVGAPRADDLVGKISIFNSSLVIQRDITGEQMGSYFGHTVVVADLNNDGLDDIVVGAPFLTDRRPTVETWEAGRVYVYYQESDVVGTFSEPEKITGETNRARMGFAIAAIGDINLDGFNDIAIGAPYAGVNQTGLVYIYMGTAKGQKMKRAQVLAPSDFGQDLKTFGFSVSGGIDIDNNMYPDMIIGSYNSDVAVVARSRPVITIDAELTIDPEGVDIDNPTLTLPDGTMVTPFAVTLCLTYQGTPSAASIEVEYSIVMDARNLGSPRALFVDSNSNLRSGSEPLSVNNRECRQMEAYVKNNIRDKLTPIAIDLDYELNEENIVLAPMELMPILDANNPKQVNKQVYIKNNCADNVCIPDLVLTANTDTTELVIGGTESMTLNIMVNNRGEDAFQSTFTAVIPYGLQFVRVERKQVDFSVTCVDNEENVVTCDIGNPLLGGFAVEFGLTLATYQLTGERDKVTFALTAASENLEEGTMGDNVLNITIPIHVRTGLVLFGASIPEQVTYKARENPREEITKETHVGPEVTHLYEIRNSGPSTAGRTKLEISWPMQTGEEGDYLLYLIAIEAGGTGKCTVNGRLNPENLTLEATNPANGTMEEMVFQPQPADRLRRDVSQRFKRDTPTASKYQMTKTLDCSGTGQCLTITCTIPQLWGDQSEVFRIRSRLWSDTLVNTKTDYTKVDIKSVARATVLDLPYQIKEPVLPSTEMEVTTSASPDEPITVHKSVPWWVIIVSIIGGLLLLLIIIIILWKVGFFKRKKYEPVNAEKEGGMPT